MSDNFSVTPGAGLNVASNEILGIHFPRSKMVIGAPGVNDGDVSDSNPVPMKIRGTEFFSGATLFDAKVTEDGELAVTSTERERNSFVHLDLPGVGSLTHLLAVDLSDTTNWPHNNAGRIDISTIGLQIHISNAGGAVGKIKMGVITRIDGTDADVAWLAAMTFSKLSESDIIRDFNFAPSQLKMGVDGSGNLTKAVSGDKEVSIVTINTGLTLLSALGLITPDKGDVVIEIDVTSNSADFIMGFMYHGEVAP